MSILFTRLGVMSQTTEDDGVVMLYDGESTNTTFQDIFGSSISILTSPNRMRFRNISFVANRVTTIDSFDFSKYSTFNFVNHGSSLYYQDENWFYYQILVLTFGGGWYHQLIPPIFNTNTYSWDITNYNSRTGRIDFLVGLEDEWPNVHQAEWIFTKMWLE